VAPRNPSDVFFLVLFMPLDIVIYLFVVVITVIGIDAALPEGAFFIVLAAGAAVLVIRAVFFAVFAIVAIMTAHTMHLRKI